MSKLILLIDVDRPLLNGGTELFRAETTAVQSLAARLGEQIVLASVAATAQPGYMGLGIVEEISPDPVSGILVRIASLQLFPETLDFIDAKRPPLGLSELSENQFDEIIRRALGTLELDDATAGTNAVLAIARFTQQLAHQQTNRCSFSDVPTSNGVAAIIRPLDQGGQLHAQNFLFLDAEPGTLFERFAWTVGPKFEIIVDMAAMRPDIADTVNRTGLLALSDTVASWPDRGALAWHRDRFLARLLRQ